MDSSPAAASPNSSNVTSDSWRHVADWIIDEIPDGICCIRRDGVLEYANPAYRRLPGVATDSSIGLFEQSFYKNADLWNKVQKVFEGVPFEVEVQCQVADHLRKVYHVRGTPQKPQNGRGCERVIVVVEEITERKQMEEDMEHYIKNIRNEQIRFLASINSLAIGFVIIDTKNNILIKNGAVDTILNLQDMEGSVLLMGDISYIEEKLKSDTFDLHSRWQEAIVQRKVILEKEILYGSKFLRIFISPVNVSDSQTIGAVMLIEDITEQKVLERGKDEFFSIASHELRTPLTAIRGNTSMIKDFFAETLPGDVREMIEDIYVSSVRLITIVNDFLDVSRLELGKIQYNTSSFSIADLADEVLKELLASATEKKVALEMENTTESLPHVAADRDRTKQVLFNLIGNSVKFTQNGGVYLSINREDGFLRVNIRDTGRGIAKANQSLLFRKFQQADSSLLTRDTTKGTGLGLYISKLMAEGMGGKIWLNSSVEGVGTTFSFTLPVSPLAATHT